MLLIRCLCHSHWVVISSLLTPGATHVVSVWLNVVALGVLAVTACSSDQEYHLECVTLLPNKANIIRLLRPLHKGPTTSTE